MITSENEWGRACNKHGEEEKSTQDLDIDENITLKLI
jgi:hypothetical protein